MEKTQKYEADYLIDYEKGTTPIGDLPIGAKVVDPSWEWEYRLGFDYSNKDSEGNPTPEGDVKPVTWLIVAKDHYDGLESHVTLLSEELIGKHAFDNSTERNHAGGRYGYNHWGDSGTANATRGLRPWMNSTGSHRSEGFYRVFSDSFKEAVLATTVPNVEWEKATFYSTQDYIFLPSTTELGGYPHDNNTYPIGLAYPYFSSADNTKRVARIGEKRWPYYTRSPRRSSDGCNVRCVLDAGGFHNIYAEVSGGGVRPVLNLKAETLVSEIRNS